MGGMAVFFGIIVSAGVTSIVFNSYALFTCVVTMTVMMYMGFIDDLVGIKPWIRIAIEVAVIGFVVIIAKRDLKKATNILRAAHQPYRVIGVMRKGSGVVTYKN